MDKGSRIAFGHETGNLSHSETSHQAGDEDSLASPWQRLWSKTLDLNLYMIPLTLIATLLGFFDGSEHPLYSGMILLPFAIAIDAIIISTIGNSIGRAIIGIRVEKNDGEKLTVAEALRRGLRVYFFGMGMGLPLVSFFTYLHNLKRLNKNRPTSWDEAIDTSVSRKGNTTARTWLTAILTIAIAMTIRVLYMADAGKFDRYGEAVTQELSPRAMAMDRAEGRPKFEKTDDPIHYALLESANELKKSLPQKLDPITLLTDVTVDGRLFTYHYNILRRDGSDNELMKNQGDRLSKDLCSDQDFFEFMKDYEVVYRYRYRMPNSEIPIVIDIDYAQCKAKGIFP